jgi:hypothetical protein
VIFYPQQDGTEGEESPLKKHIAGQMSGACDGHLAESGHLDDLAGAVADFVESSSKDGTVESNYLVMLASKALSSIGEQGAAHRLFLMGAGLMRPSSWEVAGGDAMWVLDLKEMTVCPDVPLEIVFFNSLSAILEMIAEVWDPTSGSGAIGLRNVSSAAAALLGHEGRKDEVEAVADEIKDMCAAKLEQIRAERNWAGIPAVLDLDLGPNY